MVKQESSLSLAELPERKSGALNVANSSPKWSALHGGCVAHDAKQSMKALQSLPTAHQSRLRQRRTAPRGSNMAEMGRYTGQSLRERLRAPQRYNDLSGVWTRIGE